MSENIFHSGKRLKSVLLAQLICFVVLHVSYGQHSELTLPVTSYAVEQGLSQSMVQQVCQDERGLIWMATGDGLHCFNGNTFRVFRVSTGHDSYPENKIRDLLTYKPGFLLLATSSSIVLFNTTKGDFKVITRQSGNYPRLFNARVSGNPVCWYPATGFSLVDGDKLIPLKMHFEKGTEPPRDFAPEQIEISPQGKLLIVGHKGIIECNVSNNSLQIGIQARWIPVSDGCQAVAVNNKRQIFLLKGRKVHIYNGNNGFEKYTPAADMVADYLYFDSKNNLWLFDNKQKKIHRMSNQEKVSLTLVSTEGKLKERIKPQIISAFEDFQHNLWFSTDGNGAILYSPGSLQFNLASIGFTRTITEHNGQIIAGTFRNGLWKLSPDLGSAMRINPAELTDRYYFLDLTTDKYNQLWALTNEGILLLNKNYRIIKKYPGELNSGRFIKNQDHEIIVHFSNSTYWFNENLIPQVKDTLSMVSARNLIKIGKNYWAGTPFGIYCFDEQQFMNHQISDFRNMQISQEPTYITLLLHDTVWVAGENGINCFTTSGKLLKKPESLNEMNFQVTYALLADKYGRIWFSGNKGIGCISAARHRIIHFNMQNNLQSLEFNSNAVLGLNNGQLYFGGINGVNHVNPEAFEPQKKGPVVRLFSFYIADTTFTKGIPSENITLSADMDHASISGSSFTTDYPNTGMQQYSYFLEGYQKTWDPFSADPSFNYRNLPPGSYKLWVKCLDAFKNQGDNTLLLTLRVEPPFWMTWWFISLLLAVIILIVIGVVRKINEARYKARLRELQQQNAIEKERLRISKDMHDEVGASLTRISILSELARQKTGKAQKTSAYIAQINEISGNVVDEMSEIIWAINPRNDNPESFASHIRQFVSNYLEPTGIIPNFKFQEPMPELTMSSELRRNLFLTMKEAIHNLVKYSGSPNAEITLSFSDGSIHASIRDFGQGFNTLIFQKKGNGLQNMQKRIEDSGGRFKLSSVVGQGTLIEIVLPMPAK